MMYLNHIVDNDKMLIEEMPQGCVIHKNGVHITIESPKDAEAIIASLLKMISVQFPNYKIKGIYK